MTQEHKTAISAELNRLAGSGKNKTEKYKYSQLELSARLGISNATVSKMISGHWDTISDAMWRKVQAILKIDINWNTGRTSNYVNLIELLSAAQARHLTIGISFNAGVGKSHAYTDYEKYNRNVIHVECAQYWKTKTYSANLLKACGIVPEGTVEEMIERFIDHVMGLESPIIIIDQMDKLKDGPFDLFMDIYNYLFRFCSFVVSGVPALKKRILRGVKNDKIGYREIYSRLHGNFLELDIPDYDDVSVVCRANGLTDEDEISRIYNLSEGDLRVVRKEVSKYFLLQGKEVA